LAEEGAGVIQALLIDLSGVVFRYVPVPGPGGCGGFSERNCVDVWVSVVD
jgi:hypothetical protein